MPKPKPVTFEQAAGQDAETYLETQAQPFYLAVLTAVSAKQTPEQIYHEVLAAVGPDRNRLAIRCRQFAAYLQGQGE